MLLSNGVPWHIAWGCEPGEPSHLRPAERLALRIAFGEMQGGEWDWDAGGWRQGA